MKQNRYDSVISLIAGGTNASAGAGAHGVSLGAQYGLKPGIDFDRDGLISAKDEHANAVAELNVRYQVLKAQTAATYRFTRGVRDVLRRSLGNSYSLAWQGTGFNNGLSVPENVDKLEALTRSLKSYLTEHAELEVAQLNITAAEAETVLNLLVQARANVNLQKTVVGIHLAARKQKEKAMRMRLRGTIHELSRLLDPLDDRWLAYGFNKPGLEQTPDQPEAARLKGIVGGAPLIEWKKQARAAYYRIWLRIIGQDEEAQVVGTAADLDFALGTLPSGTQAEVAISAVNSGGESARSEKLTVIVP